MLHNTGAEEMKVVCFFAPPTIHDAESCCVNPYQRWGML